MTTITVSDGRIRMLSIFLLLSTQLLDL